MRQFVITRTLAGVSEDRFEEELPHAGDLHRYLEDRGYQVGGVSVRMQRQDGAIVVYEVTVRADRDPAGEIDGFFAAPSLRATAKSDLTAALAAIRGKAPGSRTQAERAVMALTRLLGYE